MTGTLVEPCLLCRPSWRDGKTIYQGRGWRVTPHPAPAAGTERHLLLFPELHAADLLDLPGWVQVSVWHPLSWLRGAYKLTHYGLVTRGGDPALTGAGFEHAHLEVVVGAVEQPGHGGVRVDLSRPAKVVVA